MARRQLNSTYYMRSYLSEKGRALVQKIASEMDRRPVRMAA
jgi:hypothetical protein